MVLGSLVKLDIGRKFKRQRGTGQTGKHYKIGMAEIMKSDKENVKSNGIKGKKRKN